MIPELLQAIRLTGDPPLGLGEGDDDVLLSLVGHEQVGAWLWHRLRTARVPTAAAPRLQQGLRAQALSQSGTSLRIGAVTGRVLTLLASHGIRPILLKGVAYLAVADRYPFFRFRTTADADLLVEPGAADAAWQLLVKQGFRRASEVARSHEDHHHLPPLVSDAQVTIEVHASAFLRMSPEESWRRFDGSAIEAVLHGTAVRVPGPTDMLWHNVVHSLGDGPDGCRLRTFLTAAALMSAGDIDWECLAHWMAQDWVGEHDSRRAIPAAAMKRWLTAAAWFADRDLPADFRSGQSPERHLVRLMAFRQRRLAAWPRSERGQRLVTRWMDEATRAEFGLGLGRLGHWQPAIGRPKWLASSLGFRLMYQVVRSRR